MSALDNIIRHLGKQCNCLAPEHKCDNCEAREGLDIIKKELEWTLQIAERVHEKVVRLTPGNVVHGRGNVCVVLDGIQRSMKKCLK